MPPNTVLYYTLIPVLANLQKTSIFLEEEAKFQGTDFSLLFYTLYKQSNLLKAQSPYLESSIETV